MTTLTSSFEKAIHRMDGAKAKATSMAANTESRDDRHHRKGKTHLRLHLGVNAKAAPAAVKVMRRNHRRHGHHHQRRSQRRREGQSEKIWEDHPVPRGGRQRCRHRNHLRRRRRRKQSRCQNQMISRGLQRHLHRIRNRQPLCRSPKSTIC